MALVSCNARCSSKILRMKVDSAWKRSLFHEAFINTSNGINILLTKYRFSRFIPTGASIPFQAIELVYDRQNQVTVFSFKLLKTFTVKQTENKVIYFVHHLEFERPKNETSLLCFFFGSSHEGRRLRDEAIRRGTSNVTTPLDQNQDKAWT